MEHNRHQKNPGRFEDQKQLGGQNRIEHKKTVRDACKHLRTGEADKYAILS